MHFRLLCAVAALVAAFACAAAMAQTPNYPVKPVRLVIPFPPGGAVDALARAMANDIGKLWGQPVIVDGRPGAGAVTSAVAVAHSAPDGYTIYMTDSTPIAITPFLQRDLPYDPVKDFAPVIVAVRSSSVLVVSSSYPVNTLTEFIAAAKAKPGAVNFGSWGIASTAHLDTEEFAAAAGLNLTHVPFKGAADMFRSLMSGEIQTAFISLGAAGPLVKQGRLKALAYAAPKRAALLPDVPTTAEAGFPFETRGWLGWIAPAATPRAVINRIAADAGQVIAVPAFREKYIEGVGFEVSGLTGEPFARLIEESRATTGALIRRLKLQAN